MIDETWRAHTDADTISNFQKPLLEQDPFFGITHVLERIIKRSNEVRWPSRFLAIDEEIIALLGKCGASQYCKDKKNKRGPKVFSLNGCNFLGVTSDSIFRSEKIIKGYYH